MVNTRNPPILISDERDRPVENTPYPGRAGCPGLPCLLISLPRGTTPPPTSEA